MKKYILFFFLLGISLLASSQVIPLPKRLAPKKEGAPQNNPASQNADFKMKNKKGANVQMLDGDRTKVPDYKLFAKVINDNVYLRWYPLNQSNFAVGNRDGYILKRIDIDTGIEVILGGSLILPKTELEFKAIYDSTKNNHIGALAGAIHGENVTVGDDILKQVTIQNQIFGFAMVASSISFKGSELAGLGYIDSTATYGKIYKYIITNQGPPNYNIKPDSVLITVKEAPKLPDLENVFIDFENKGAVFSLITDSLLQVTYTSYDIERSIDSLNFKKLNELPIVNTSLSDTLYITDSLANNNLDYYYRIRGNTQFEESGPYSQILKGKGINPLTMAIISNYKVFPDSNSVRIRWVFPDSLEADISGFLVKEADSYYGEYTSISNLLPADNRTFKFSPKNPEYYLTVNVIAKDGREIESYPYLITMPDSTAPAPPQNVKIDVDTTGLVNISWDENQERDLLGYNVLRTYIQGSQYIRTNISLLDSNSFVDTLNLKLLNKNIYYSVQALDKHFNQSDNAAEIQLKLPDINPPRSPVMIDYKIDKKSIKVSWSQSPSEDVVNYILQRAKFTDNTFQILGNFDPGELFTYSDTNILANTTYIYNVIAVDSSLNKSDVSNSLTLESVRELKTIELESYASIFDKEKNQINISWKCKNIEEVEVLYLYRSIGEKDLQLIREMEVDENQYSDALITDASNYRYVIRAKMKDGYLSGWQEITIDIKR
jgi:hypothetical protein